VCEPFWGLTIIVSSSSSGAS